MAYNIDSQIVSGWHLHYLNFPEGKLAVATVVPGKVANSTATSERQEWQRKIAKKVYWERKFRGEEHWHYVISIGIRFCATLRRNAFDVDNYTKHAKDAVAVGLMEEKEENINTRKDFNGKDNNFRYIFNERLEDVNSYDDEGIGIVVCCKEGLGR